MEKEMLHSPRIRLKEERGNGDDEEIRIEVRGVEQEDEVGRGERVEYTSELHLRAVEGNLDSLYCLALSYLGSDDENNRRIGVHYLGIAANKRHPGAQYDFGLCCEHEIGISEDDPNFHDDSGCFSFLFCRKTVSITQRAALIYYTLAAEAGHPEGLFKVGLSYFDGRFGQTKSSKKAREFLDLAVAAGSKRAHLVLGILHSNGSLGKVDLTEALGHFSQAEEVGVPKAEEFVKRLKTELGSRSRRGSLSGAPQPQGSCCCR
ncbi:tetratricopeptide repeat protein [Pseudomonadota bacterium]